MRSQPGYYSTPIPEWDQCDFRYRVVARIEMNERTAAMNRRPEDLFRAEAERLAKLPARERKAELAVHWRIAEDAKLLKVTRDYARHVAETLETLIREIRKK